MNVKKLCLKILAVLMALTMTVGVGAPVVQASALLGSSAGAEAKDVIHYVSLGDSMTNGYGFDGYEQGDLEPGTFVSGGEGIYGYAAYPNRFAEWLEDTYYHGEKTVNHIRLASSAMRAEDLLFLLGGREMAADGWFSQINHYTGEDDNARLSAYYQESIAKADIISMCIGNASFGAYMVQYLTRAMGVMGGQLDDEDIVTLEDALVLVEDQAEKQVVLDVYADMKARLTAAIPAEMAEQYRVGLLCDAAAYITAGFLLNYKGVVEKIVELNPDAEIMLVGLMNTTYGMKVPLGEDMEPIALGDILDGLFDLLNMYMAGLPAVMKAGGACEEVTFYYASQPTPRFIVQAFDDLAASGWKNVDCGDADCGTVGHDCGNRGRLSADVVRSRSIAAYNEGLRYVIGAAMQMDLPAITMDDVKAYTGHYGSNVGIDISTAIYLGIEDAVVASVDTMEIPLDGLANIAGDLSNVFDGMPAALNPANNPTPAIIRDALGTHLTSTATMRGMCKVYGFFKIGNGMSVHPMPAGHDNLFEAVKAAYVEGHTAEDETASNAVEALKTAAKLVAEHYEEAYAHGYRYAVENGYVAEAREAIAQAKAAIQALNLDEVGMTPAFRSALEAELAAVTADLDRLDAVLASGQAATVDGLLEAVASMEDDLYTHLANLELLLTRAGADVTELAILPAVRDIWVRIETEVIPAALEAAEQIAEQTYAYLLEKLSEVCQFVEDGYTYLLNPDRFMTAWNALGTAVEKLGTVLADRVWDALRVDESIRAITDALEALESEIADTLTYLTAVQSELEAELAALKARLDAAIILADSAAAKLEAMISAVESKIARVRAAVCEIRALAVRMQAHADRMYETIETVKELAEQGKAEAERVLPLLMDAAASLAQQMQGEASEAVAELKALLNRTIPALRGALSVYIAQALVGEYVISEDSYYVAITGDSSAYADQLAEALDVSYGKQTWGALDFDELAKADLITIGYDEAEINRFALNQVLGYAKHYLDTELRSSATAYAHIVAEKLFGNMLTDAAVATVPAAVDNTISQLLTHPLLADKTLETIDWTAVIGEENLPYVEQLRREIRESLLSAGIPAAIPLHVDVVDYLFMSAPEFGASVTKLLEKIDRKKLEDKLGEDAVYTIQVPVIDFVMMAVEAELYSTISFHKAYAETVLTLKEVNPDAAVAVLGHYNPFDGLVIPMSGATLDLGVIYDVVKDASSAHSFFHAVTADVTYVDISDTETVCESMLAEGEIDLLGVVAAYLADPAVAQPSDAGHAYIRDQILSAYTITCAHSWIDATCTDAKICARCGVTEGEALGHTWTDATCTECKTCSVCGVTEGEALGHTWADATCTEPKTCSVCGVTEGEALGHVWTDATCTECKTCSVCGATEGNANGHAEETIPAVPATCTEDGLTEGKKCSVCGEILAAQQTIPAVGHTEEEIPGVEATCDEEGLETGTKCSVCGEILLAQVTIPARGHNLTEATCTKAPYCTVCGEISEGAPIEHTWTEATCEQPATCTVCGATEGELAAHTYGEWTVVTEATKKAEGKQERTCSVCGGVESEAIPQLEGCASVLGALTVICVTLAGAAVTVRKKED